VIRAILPSVLSVLLLSAPPAFASPQSKSAPTAQQEVATQLPNRKQIELFHQAKVALPQVIAAAKNQGGGKLMDVTFDASNGKPVYKVKTYQNNEVWEVAIDAQSGQFIGYGTTTPEGQLDKEDKAELAGLQQANVTLAQAAETAEKNVGGKAMSASLEATNGKVVYEIIVILKTDSARKVTVDPKTGKLTDG
jgi:uncharacterized membrane protein YkoI